MPVWLRLYRAVFFAVQLPTSATSLLRHRDVRGLAQHFALGGPEALRDGIEPDDLGLGEHGLAVGAVAVDPLHEVVLLPGRFDQIPQESLFVVG